MLFLKKKTVCPVLTGFRHLICSSKKVLHYNMTELWGKGQSHIEEEEEKEEEEEETDRQTAG
jgi:hypothetical protein